MNWNIMGGLLSWVLRVERPAMPLLCGYRSRLWRMARMELFICILVLSVLVVLAASIYQGYQNKAETLQAVIGGPAQMARLDVHLYLAHTGTWPSDSLQAKAFLPESDTFYHIEEAEDPSMAIEDGAVHLTFAKPFEGQRLSIRPAVPEKDPLGPIAWFCMAPLKPAGWSVAGEDKTDLPEDYIQNQLR